MAGLNTSLSIAVQSLEQQSTALDVTNNNIANANTPGYSRETLVLSESATVQENGVSLGAGATLEGVQSVRDQLLTLRIQQQTSQQSSADAQASGLTSIQTSFASGGSDIGTELSAFFASVATLSSSPSSTSARQSVLSQAQNVAASFHSTSAALTGEQTALDGQVSTDVSQINQLSQQIAALNRQLQQGGTGAANNGTLVDEQNQLVLELSKLTNVSVIQTGQGESITTGNGTPLVLGSQSFALGTSTGSDGLTHVLDSNGSDITASISGGDLGGTLALQTTISSLLSQLDTLAGQFGAAINDAQAQGFDQNGKAGTALFAVSGPTAGAAARIAVATTDPSSIAASSDGSPGSNGNVANLSAVQTAALPSGKNPTDAYASLVYQVGSAASTASAESTAIGQSLSQLTTQQSSVSGVSIDEESANLVRYQQSYEAAARVISTIQTLFSVLDNISTSG